MSVIENILKKDKDDTEIVSFKSVIATPAPELMNRGLIKFDVPFGRGMNSEKVNF